MDKPYQVRHESKFHYVDGPDSGLTHGTVFFDESEYLVDDVARLLNIAFEEGKMAERTEVKSSMKFPT